MPQIEVSSEILDNYDSGEAFLEQATNALKNQDAAIFLPQDGASAEEIQTFRNDVISKDSGLLLKPESPVDFYKQYGAPEKGSDYDMSTIDGELHQFMEGSEWLQDAAADSHLTQDQYNGFMQVALEKVQSITVAQTEAANKQKDALAAEWGDSFESNVKIVDQFAKEYFGEDHKVATPVEYKGLLKMQSQFSEGETPAIVKDVQSRKAMTPEIARQKMASIRNNADSPFRQGDRDAAIEMVELQKVASQGGA